MLFSIGIKVFPYGSEINSVRILIVKMEHDPSLEKEPDVDENWKPLSTKSKRSKSKKSKRGSSRKSEKGERAS